MTVRAIILGLLGAVFIATVGHLNAQVARLNVFAGNHFPLIVFGPLILMAALVNPLLRLLGAKWAFRPAELAVATTLMLVACNLPGSGLLRFFPRSLIMPLHANRITPGWQKNKVLSYVPDSMLPGEGDYDPEVMDGALGGRGKPGAPIGLDRVPWAKWWPVLATWLPMVICVAVAAICMSLVVHRQWSRHERLRYPIADFAHTLISPDGDPDALSRPPGASRSIFRNRLFWIGLAIVFGIRLLNGLHVWFPERCIQIDLSFNFHAIRQKFPFLSQAQWSGSLTGPTLYPTAVAFAFFLATDVSFSIGISQILWVPLAAWCVLEGLPMQEDFMTGGLPAWQRFGSYVGVAVMVLYVGRRYYGRVLRAALGGRRDEETPPYVPRAARIGLLAALGIFLMFCRLQLPWHVALLMVAMMLMSYFVMARINAESGMVLSQAYWQPTAVLMGLFGAGALGPQALIVSGMLCVMFTIDRRECLMPFLINGLKLCGDRGLRPAPIGRWAMATFLIALGAAVPVALWSDYNFGISRGEGWATMAAPKYTFQTASAEITKLKLAIRKEAAP